MWAPRVLASVADHFRGRPPAFSLSTYSLVGATSLALLGLVDFLVQGRRLSVATVTATLGAGLLAGAVCALPLAVVLRGLAGRLWRVSLPVWAGGGAFVGAHLVRDLGVVENWSGRHATLAHIALVASVGVGLTVTSVALALQPTLRQPRGWLPGLRPGWRIGAGVVLALGIAASIFIDRFTFPSTYPAAHVALRWLTGLLTLTLLLLAWPYTWQARWPRSVRRSTLGAAVVVAALPLVLLPRAQRADVYAVLRPPFAGLSIGLLRAISDVDGDGYSSLLAGGDCAPLNAGINPGAEEIPGNGVDENCLGGDGRGLSTQTAADVPIPTEPSPISVVLVTIDTLPASRVGVYGYDRMTTPSLDRWSRSALRFERAYSGGPWTALAVPSLYRGVYPRRLAWTWVYETDRLRLFRKPLKGKLNRQEKARKVFLVPIGDSRPTLPWWLVRRGMVASAIVDDGPSQFLSPKINITSGWSDYRVVGQKRGRDFEDVGVTRHALKRLEQLRTGGPFFLWVHYFGAHEPLRKNQGSPIFGSTVSDLYDAKLRFTDREAGKLLKRIDEIARTRPLAVIVAADHGEEFTANDRNHGGTLLDTTVRVPLLVRGPGFIPGSTDAVVSLVDLMPTILTWTDTPLPDGLDGKPLQEVLAVSPPPQRHVISETWGFSRGRQISNDRIAIIGSEHMLVWDLLSGGKRLVRTGDPAEEAGDEENLIDEIDASALEEVAARYLDQNREVRRSD